MYFFLALTYFPHRGCLYMRSTITVTLFIILLDTTTPFRGFTIATPFSLADVLSPTTRRRAFRTSRSPRTIPDGRTTGRLCTGDGLERLECDSLKS